MNTQSHPYFRQLMKLMTILVCVNGYCFLSACKSKTPNPITHAQVKFSFPDETRAKQIIIRDKKEHFFGRINNLDRQIQMKRENDKSISLDEYKQFLESDITTFTPAEQSRLEILFNNIHERFDKIGIHVNIDDIYIIKTKGLTYGPQAFFTRENAIFIPAHQMEMPDDGLRSVLLHEIFHIVSRYDERIKKATYNLIGFSPLGKDFKIEAPHLSERILLNPDGLDNSYVINLKNEAGESLQAVAVLYSKHKKYSSSFADYFDYIYFELYKYDETNGTIEVKDDLGNTIPADYFNNFFDQISDNTQYIIHPDEIMADNFMLMVNSYYTNEFGHFSESGKVIINKLHSIFSSDK